MNTPEAPKQKIIDSFGAFVVATLCVGPLALPLLWRNPRYSSTQKWVGTVIILGLTYVALRTMGDTYKQLREQIEFMRKLQEQ